MAKKPNQNKNPGKGWVAALLAGGGTSLLYSALFPMHRLGHYAIAGALALLLGRVAYIMFSGLDTSQKAPSMDDLPVTGNEPVDRLIARGQELLKDIRREDELIPDPELSKQIVELERISNRIFQTVIEQPGKAPQIRRFMDYYLPTTLKMLTGYRKLDERGIKGARSEATKQRIESAMEVVLGAFRKQLETLYQNDMLDITTDIDVLEAMLKQDSLLGSDFQIKNQQQKQPGLHTQPSAYAGQAAGAQAQQQKEE